MIEAQRGQQPSGVNVFLVGPMGSGKSTVGRKLATSLGKRFIDSDAVIVERTGASIPLIFEIEGEAGFRDRESKAIDDLTGEHDIVLATGGGAAIRNENRARLAQRGFVVYLFTSVDQQLKRAGRDKNRPLLQNDDPRAVLQSLFDVRDPLYRECADLIVTTDNRSVAQVAREIRGALAEHQ